ncbi:MAG: M48 family metalloprotease [Sulfurifustaceae bacterium]
MQRAAENYTVIFPGCSATGDELVRIKARLASIFKLSPQQVDRLCSSRDVIVRRDASLAEAEKFKAAFERAGVVCQIVRQNEAAPTQTAAVKSPDILTVESLDKFFPGAIPNVRVSFGYRVGLLALACLMLLLPVLYVLMLIGVGSAGVWYAKHAPALLGRARGLWWIVAYGAPVVSAFAVCVAMLKPLLAREPKRREPLPLSRTDEPLFFAFVDKICDKVGARRPARVQLDCAVNASAALQNGASGFFGGELVLTVGMPLLAGLDTRQLAGVLAHEFGHFAQRAGMRASALIHRINYWLYKCVYLRDSWDEALVAAAERVQRIAGVLGFVLYIALAATWVARGVLWSLMWFGTVVSRYMSRQMEYDADRYEAHLVGSRHFRETALRMRLLSHAFSDVYQSLGRSWADRKLVDNLPHLVARRARELEPQLRRHIEAEIEKTQTLVYDTHPADRERIENAERLKAAGIFAYQAPARVLVKNYAAWAKRSTWHFYRAELGLSIKPDQLISIDDHEAAVGAERKSDEALQTYFHGFFEPTHFFPAPDLEAAMALDADRRKARLAELVMHVRTNGPEINAVTPAFAQAKNTLADACGANAIAAAGAALPPDAPDYAKASEALAALEARVAKLDQLFRERLGLGLAEAVAQAPNRDALLAEARRLVAALQALTRLYPKFLATHRESTAVLALAWLLERQANNEAAQKALRVTMTRVKSGVAGIEEILQSVQYPFARGAGDADALRHFLEELPVAMRDKDFPQYLEYAHALYDTIVGFHARVAGRLAKLALDAEERLGLRVKLLKS